ncbi:hypothetical protein [Paenibacillus piri]|uniref:Calcineurin-like phosphoesterase domain-containing protein n=1 Tax=Paenibacillus piri TaxID=2547395 RepID=A0A4R5K9S8_9BACL|nr:hypothetical protein [Paenibacillus piri]TDF91345.1 hypothetical protein E1757_32975 [Paenibacillus piri]
MKFNHLLVSSDKQAIIEVEGLARPLTIFHLTDCHMNETDDRGAGALVESIRAYGLDALDTRHRFERALAYADEHAVDCVALTGDAVNGATQGNLDSKMFFNHKSNVYKQQVVQIVTKKESRNIELEKGSCHLWDKVLVMCRSSSSGNNNNQPTVG